MKIKFFNPFYFRLSQTNKDEKYIHAYAILSLNWHALIISSQINSVHEFVII